MSLRNFSFFILFLVLHSDFIGAKESCSLQLGRLIFKPFVYTSGRKLLPSNDNTIVVNDGQNVIITCEMYNFEKYPRQSNINAVCNDGKLTSDTGDVLSSNDLCCGSKIVNMMKCDLNCPTDHIGLCTVYYDNNLKSNIKLSEICYNTKINRIAFAKIRVTNELFPESHKIGDDMKLEEFINKISIIRNLIGLPHDNMTKLLLADDDSFTIDYITVRKTIPKGIFNGQLNDVADYPINNIGMWRSIAEGNRRRTIDDIKIYTKSKNEQFDLIFGTHQTLKTHDGNILYHRGKIEMIPQYIWTVVYEKKSKKGAAIVTINDPFLSLKELKKLVFCNSICNDVSWLHNLKNNENYDRPAMGYTFCCSLNDFAAIYSV